ncbi:S8 family peptidase [Rhizomonospora bruguierae]|uniref:S8 family peptidase n=1 Tax=Rhizomonospora bruguierae TaxID=1581705 RepID=UPI001BCC1DD3|nr:S8/S53 family peptidase [Micromonospora sp. NBRC 107566]
MSAEYGERKKDERRARRDAQVELILSEFGDRVEMDPPAAARGDVRHLFRRGILLVRDGYLDQVTDTLRERARVQVEAPLVPGVTALRVEEGVVQTRDLVRRRLGEGIASLDYLVGICPGAGVYCPATEPEPVAPGAAPLPLSRDRDAGKGVRVVVIDTGLDPAAPASHPWLAGVTGDPDPAIGPGGALGPYAGHGTFVAGVLRRVAPAAEVIVRRVFTPVGAAFESDLVTALDEALTDDAPDIISMSAGTYAFEPTGLLGLGSWYQNRLRHHKGVAVVVAAGNDGAREAFWPAAAPWTFSVGALNETLDGRAWFSNFGGWVDVYTPGENLVNAYPKGTYRYNEPPSRQDAKFDGMAAWSGTSFSTPIFAGLVAARMARTGENGCTAARALLSIAQQGALFGVGAVLLP